MIWNVYLSGEIHTDWRDQIIQKSVQLELPIEFTSAVTDHQASDAAGDVLEQHLVKSLNEGDGSANSSFWRDHQSAKVNGIRTKTMLESCNLAVIRFGDKYKQWNAAFDAGYCAAMGTPYITLHSQDIIHPLKEVDSDALAWAQTVDQVVEVLKYVTTAK